VLEEREVLRVGSVRATPVDVRVIAATHCELDTLVREGRFRRDLYYRLNVLRIALAPLRQHADDVPLLLMSFLRATGAGAMVIDGPAEAALLRHDWPGNVRELRNLAERIAVLGHAESPLAALTRPLLARCAPEMFATAAADAAPAAVAGDPQAIDSPLPRSRPAPAALAALLQQHGGQRGAAARALGVSRSTLWRWLQEDGAS